MNRIFRISVILFLTLVFTTPALYAEIKLPSVFGPNMVLQQQSQVAVWGKAKPNTTVKVTSSWNNKSYSCKSSGEGKWELTISTPVAGDPYEITISDGTAIKLKNVLIGEVWVCSGQSNMEMPVKGFKNQPVIGSNEAISTSENTGIRLFTVAHSTSPEPLDDFSGEWKECLPENVANFSATAYFFGRMLNEVLNVPVGLICSSWGGTRIEPWINEEGIKRFDWVKLPDKKATGEKLSQQTPTVLYNAMISPMVGYGIKGCIWYQGEANRNEPKEYEKLMPGLIENWRSAWGIGDFSFYYAQIAPYDYTTIKGGLSSAFVREAQLNASDDLPNIGMATLMDIGEKDCIHPSNKKITGERLAYSALAKTYGKAGFACSGPVLKEMKIEGSMVNLTFDNASNGLTSFGKELSEFEIAGENKRFYPANAAVTSTGISVVSPSVPVPVAVRYAFRDFVEGTLYNTEGLPASSFRTDTWDDK